MWPRAQLINLLARKLTTRKRRGFGIAETLIASFILASMVLGFFGLTAALGRNIKSAYYRSVAANLAQSQLERLRWQVESNWQNSRLPGGSNPDNWDANINLPFSSEIPVGGKGYTVTVGKIEVTTAQAIQLTQATATGSEFISQTEATRASIGYQRVQVSVSWDEGGQARTYTVESFITNWREGLM